MKLNIPCSPFEMTISVARRPDARWGRLGLRGLLILVALAAFCVWSGIGIHERYASSPTVVKTYNVSDLMIPGAVTSVELPKLAARLESSPGLHLWGSRSRAIIPFPLSQSLIIRESDAGHQCVEAWLQKQRSRLQAAKP
jgi:hypothetical protein